MFYLRYRPSPPLYEFLDRFWLCSDLPAHPREQILPSGTSELVVNLRENEFRIYDPIHRDRYRKFRGAMVSGAYDRFFVIDPSQHASIAGVHFKPGAASPFVGVPAGELADAHVDLDVLWGGSAAELRERLCAASTPAERFRVLEETLLDRFRPTRRHAGVAAAIEAFQRIPSPSVREITRSVGLSDRRLIQLFTSEVGMTPTRYLRVGRFQRARRLASRGTKTDWPDVAVACGYFDQSHLIHDFEEFSGLRPTEYLQRSAARVLPNHVPADRVNFFQYPRRRSR